MNELLNIVPEFINESLESISGIEKVFNKIIKDIEKGRPASLKNEETIFRTLHSINGGSSFLGLESIEKISGWLEKILFFLKNEKLQPDKSVAMLVKDIFYLIKESLSNSKGNVGKRPFNKLYKQVLALFEKMNGSAQEHVVEVNIDGREFSFSVNPAEVETKLQSQSLYILSIDPVADLDENKWGLSEFIKELTELGDILDSVIDIENVFEDSVPVSVLFLSKVPEKKLKSRLKDIPKEKILKIDRETAFNIFGIEKTPESEMESEIERPDLNFEEDAYNEKAVRESEDSVQDIKEDDDKEFVSFRIGKEYYAVSIRDVFDMKEMLPCSRIPRQPDYMLGVTNLRGNVVPVIDLRLLMGRKDVIYDEFSVFLIVKVNNKITGCVVDAIDDVVFLEPENTQITPVTSRQINIDYVKFVAKDPKTDRFLIVLDLEKMLSNE